MFNVPYTLGTNSLSVFLDGKSFSVNRESKIFDLVLNALKSKDAVALRQALTVKQSIATKLANSSDAVTLENGKVFCKGREVSGLISTRVLEMLELGLDLSAMAKFIENLMDNPSFRAVNELFGFIEACDLPITPDGHFLAYKRIRADYKDCYSGTMDNSVGKIVEMPRNRVNEDKNQTCSYGLHACSYDYLANFSGERIVVVKINPRDVVSVPIDYNNSKLRTCRYEVLEELPLDGNNMPQKRLSWDDAGYDEHNEDDAAVESTDSADSADGADSTTANPSAKINAQTARTIRALYDFGDSVKSLASLFGISERQVRRIINFESWANA